MSARQLKKKDYKFIVNTITNWNEPPRARHQVTSELSQLFKTVFVSANQIGIPKIKISQENHNLSVVFPFFPINTKIRYRIPLLNELYQYWLFSQLKKKFPEYSIINFDFTAKLIFRFFNRPIYYCNDNFSAISKRINPGIIYRYHQSCEEKVARNSAFCIVISEILKNKISKFNPNVYTIPLGGPDINRYNIKINYNIKNPDSQVINIGLVGFIKEYNISYQVINSILSVKNLFITMIGPVEDKFMDKLIHKEKVRILGTLYEKKLLEAINDFDVGIAPYRSEKMNEGGTPNKLLLYLSLGKPVVVSNLASLTRENHPEDLYYIAQEDEDFASLIFHSIRNNTTELIKQRAAFARENTWEKRISKFVDIYQSHNSTD